MNPEPSSAPDDDEQQERRWSERIGAHARLWLALGVLATGLGFLGGLHWAVGLAAHFRVQYVLAALMIGIVAALVRDTRAVVVAAALVCVNVAPVIGATFIGVGPDPDHARALSVMSINVYRDNPDAAAVQAAIREARPDVVGLIEVNARWGGALLEPLKDLYPHQKVATDESMFGLALLSRTPLRDAELIAPGGGGFPVIRARVEGQGGREVTILLVHPPPPIMPSLARAHEAQLDALPEVVRGAGERVVLMGDLNATPWSHPFQALLSGSGLRDSRVGVGIHTTWPAAAPIAGLPLDHVLVKGLEVVARRIGPDVGSDHLPVLVELGW
ncbi:MAG: hypothetical protein CMH57_03925 [Myxococcales bacterium]|nr:hypothetical protein [Myxococcales bacterium]